MSRDVTMNDSPIRLTRAEASAVDRYAVEVLGLPGVVLMENAGINAAAVVMDVLSGEFGVSGREVEGEIPGAGGVPGAGVAVLCGGGNNGGDGYVVARQLMGWGVSAVVYVVKPVEGLEGDAKVNAEAWERLGGAVVPAWEVEMVEECAAAWAGGEVVVDAMLGTGYGVEKGPVRGATAAAIAAVNRRVERVGSGGEGFRGRVVSLDVPSGMDADTGAVVGDGVRADVTVSFVAEKAGFAVEGEVPGELPGAGGYLGRVVTADIGLPGSVVAAALRWMDQDATGGEK